MEQIGKEIEKVLKAGIGAVKSGMEMSADTIEKWAEKGEPIYEAAKASLCSAAGKIKKAVDDSNIPENVSMMMGGKVTADTVKSVLSRFTKAELDAVRAIIDELYDDAPDCEQEEDEPCDCHDDCACEQESESPCRCGDEQNN